jgi:hypothetical protein
LTITNDYIKQYRLKLATEVKDAVTIYLDTKFWIDLVNESIQEDSSKQIMLNLTYKLVEEKICIFPMSDIILWEILKQTDYNSRNKTFELVDRLSKGISIISSDELIYLQSRRFFEMVRGNEVEKLTDLIWTKTTLLNLNLNCPLEFYRFLANESFSKWHNELSKDNFKLFHFQTNTTLLNEQSHAHKSDFNDFRKLHLTEIAGTIDANKEMLDAIEPNLGHLFFGEMMNDAIIADLPYFSIYPLLFAAIRWDHQNQFHKNDTMDFLHAASALPSCDYFFTEKQLKTLIRQRKLDVNFDCKVESNSVKILEILNMLLLSNTITL